MTESISTPNALVQTQNGKRFYVNSGLVGVDNTETSVIDIANIGERDIKLIINPIIGDDANDNMVMKLKNNGIIIYRTTYYHQAANFIMYALPFIIPANTSIVITFQNIDSTSHDVGVSCYGKYLSM